MKQILATLIAASCRCDVNARSKGYTSITISNVNQNVMFCSSYYYTQVIVL